MTHDQHTAGSTRQRRPTTPTRAGGADSVKNLIRGVQSRLFRIALEQFNADIDGTWILKVPGRRTGIWRFTPVKLLVVDDEKYLVALHPSSDWPLNLRMADGIAQLRHGRRRLPVRAVELAVEERPAILRGYLAAATRTKTSDILGAGQRHPDDDHLRRIAPGHPVFRLTFLGGHEWPSLTLHQSSTAAHGRTPLGVPKGTARWALVSGGAGLVSGLCLALFYAVGQPFAAEPSRWSWFGPANDLSSAVQAAALIPVALSLNRLLPGRTVHRWTLIGVVAMAAATILPLLLLTGLIPFTVQTPLVIAAFALTYGWLFSINRAAARRRLLRPTVANVGMVSGLALAIALLAAGPVALLPARSTAQLLATALAAVAGVIAWLGFPVWTLFLWLNFGVRPAALRCSSGVGRRLTENGVTGWTSECVLFNAEPATDRLGR
jgi:hypothetical protein